MKRLVPGCAAISLHSQSSLLFFDASVPAIADLARHSLVESCALSGAVDPLVEISRQLSGRTLETLHIVAHGGNEFILIGNAIITSDKLRQHASLLQHWQVTEILLWSCSVGARSRLVQTLSELTGATVHASDQPLGMTADGPNWTLGSGEQGWALPFVAEAAQQWPHQLVALLFSSQAYFAEDSAAPGSAKADLEENSLKLTAFVAATAMKYLFVSEPPDDPVYTGNNVHGTLYAIDGNGNVLQSYVGEISRLVKSGSTVQAAQFYIYPTPSDPTNTGSPARTILIDLNTGGKFAVGNTIGTSSDPVDAALNKLIPVASAPIAYADNGEVHLATCVSNVDTAETATPTGNVITGHSTTASASTADSGYITSWSIDTTPDPDKLVSSVSGLAVSNVKSNLTGSLSVVNSGSSSTTGAATIQGKYGVLKIGADGSYSYDADEANADLVALSSAAGSYVNEVFTYTVTQAGTGKTSTSTLTIRIDGGNDDPTAGNDYVFVNEGTAARPTTLASTTSTAGAVLADNLLSNDRDPDTGDAIKIIKAEQATSLTDETFSASAVNVTSSGVSTSSRTIGYTYVTVQFGTSVSETLSSAVYVQKSGTTGFVAANATLSSIGGTASKQATFNVGLDLGVGDIIRFGSATATNDYTIASGGLITASQTRFKLTDVGTAPSVGTDVTGPGVQTGTKITAVDGALVTLNHNVTLGGAGLDSGESLNLVSGAIYGTYGYLDLKSDGTYKYVLTADVPDNTTKDEYFTYQIEDKDHCTDTAVLHVRIEGHQVSYPAVSLKTLTVNEVGASSGSLAAVAGADIALVSGNGEFVSAVLSTHASDTVVQVGTTAGTGTNQPVHGQYGTLTMNADGKWSYLLDNDHATVDALRTSADKLYETFEYRVQNSAGQDDVSTITITIQGANDAPVANNDTGKAIEAGGQANGTPGVAASGNLFANDTDVDHGDTQTLQGFGVSSIGSLGTANPAGEYSLTGAHGTLYVKADGTWRYVVDESDTVIDALSANQTEKDTFVYRVADTAGETSDATLEVTIQGSNDSVAVNNVEVNEASSHAVFTITGHAGQEVKLQLAQTGAGVDEATLGDTADVGTTLDTGLEYYNGSQWVPYNLTTDKVTLDENGQLYVRTAIHQDDTHEGLESFLLYVTTTDGQASVGTGSIVDEANGVKYVFDPETGLPSTVTTGLDDDRAITVTGDTYNEGSPVAVFTVGATKGQSFTLDVKDVADTGKNATGDDNDTDLADGNAPGDALDTAPIYYSLDNGATWVQYTGGSVEAGDYPVLVSVDIADEGDDVYEGEEQFKLIVTTGGKDYSGYSSIIDDGSGKLLDVDANGHPIVDPNGDLTLDTETTPDDDRAITVTGDTYNEGSPVAVFTVGATKGQSFTLDVKDVADTGKNATGDDNDTDLADGNAPGDALDTAPIYYSLDNGATWVQYTGGSVEAGDYPVLVSVDITNETDDVYEGEEQFKLIVTTGGKDYSGYSSIIDDGSGKLLDVDANGHPIVDANGDLTLDTTTTPDDDRAITVTGDTYNEGSPVAVFTVGATKGQSFTLDVKDVADTGKAATGDDSDFDALDGNASGDALDAADIYYSLDNGVTWIKYTDGDSVIAGDYPVLVSVDITNETDDVYEGEEQFKLIVSTAGKDYSGYSSIVDDGSGTLLATDEFGHPIIDENGKLTLDTTTPADDDRGVIVTGDTYNEGSPVAVFTVEISKGQSFTLDVKDVADTGKAATGDDSDFDALDGNASGDALDAADIYYSLDNGVTWIQYSDGDSVIAGDYPVLVSVDITNETDDVYEGEEQFKLIVTTDGKDYSGYSSIIDDGSGKLLDVDANGHPIVDPDGDLTLDTETTPDDDRGITVTGGTYNEGSPRAVFTVTATAGQSLTLDVRDVAASGKDSTGPDAETNDLDGDDTGDALDHANLYYSLDGGHTWTLYTGAAFNAGAEPVLVAVDISNETDDVYEGEEQFQLVVTAGGNEYSGYASIIDDGSGDMAPVILDGTNLGANPYTGGDLGGTKDDDRPVDLPPPPFTADLDPATDTGDFDRITQDTEPEFTLNGGTYLQPGGTAQLLDPNGNVLDSTLITAEDVARGTVNLAPGFLDDGLYTYTARILDANGNLVAEAPVTVTVVTDRDGVMPSVELAANGGDFNHDGILDWLQNNVTQLPLSSCEAFAAGKSAPEHCFGAIMAGNVSSSAPGSPVQLDAGAQLLNVRIDPQPKPLPQGYQAETPLMNFTVQAVEGGQLADVAPDRAGLQTRIVIDLQPGGARANTYLKWDPVAQDYYQFLDDGDLSTYDDGATLLDLNGDGLIDRIVVTLTDGARGDEDGVVNGTIVDPGLLALDEPDPVYSVLLKNGDRFYTTNATEAAEMAKGSANKFEGARFDNHDGPDAQKMVAWYNPFTRDWFYGTEEQNPPYKCYVRKSELAGFDSAPAGSDSGDDVHLFVNKKGQTQLVTLDQAAELKLSSKHFVDKGVAFNASTEHAFKFDTEGYLIANHDNAGIQTLVTSLARQYHSTTSAGFVEAVEQHYLAQAQLVGLPHGDAASAADLNAVFGTHFTA